MHPYFPHLISDIAAAHREDILPENDLGQDFDEHIAELENFLENGEYMHTLGYYCGLDAEDFPPSAIFSDEEVRLICESFEEMLSSWNAALSFPENLPLSVRYKLTVAILNEGFHVLNSGTMNFDFCTGYAPECALKEYCSCLEVWDDLSDDEDMPHTGGDPLL